MRKAKVYYEDTLAGILTETHEGDFVFAYDSDYIESHPDDSITFTMPVTKTPYRDSRLFPFFEGLIPEGWLLEIASANWKINRNDRMGLIMACCQNCIGAVSVIPINGENEE